MILIKADAPGQIVSLPTTAPVVVRHTQRLTAKTIHKLKLPHLKDKLTTPLEAVAEASPTSTKSEPVMTLVHILTMRYLQKNIIIKASHVPGTHNDICDGL